MFNTAIFNNSSASPKFTDRGLVDLMDSSSTSLPTATNPTADGVAIQNNYKVLYTNLSTPSMNNQVYEASNVTDTNTGTTWSQSVFTPSEGDTLTVRAGSTNGGQTIFWNGSSYSQACIAADGSLTVTNSATASSAVGTLTGKAPIYSASGALLGYVPIYATIT